MYHLNATVEFYNKLISNITEESTLFNFAIKEISQFSIIKGYF